MVGKSKRLPKYGGPLKYDLMSAADTVIGSGTVFEGNIGALGTAYVNGMVNGDCVCTKDLIIGSDGQITGNVKARNVTVSGTVTGNIFAYVNMVIKPVGRVTGDITASSLAIENGARFDGSCMMAEVTEDVNEECTK